jgi:hypothetical protein
MTNPHLAAATWRKSSYSGGAQDCVEVASDLPGAIAVRDSKDRGGPVLMFGSRAWHAFVAELKSGAHAGPQ